MAEKKILYTLNEINAEHPGTMLLIDTPFGPRPFTLRNRPKPNDSDDHPCQIADIGYPKIIIRMIIDPKTTRAFCLHTSIPSR